MKTDAIYTPSHPDIQVICWRSYTLIKNNQNTDRLGQSALLAQLRRENISLLQIVQPLITDAEDLARSQRTLAHLASLETAPCSH